MHEVSTTREIAAPREEVWAVLDAYGNLHEYAPKNVTCRLLDGPETGVGARRETRVTDGFGVVQEITDYEPGERYTFEFMETGEYPMRELEIEFAVAERGDARSAVTMTARYEPQWGGPLGWLLAKTVMRYKTKKIQKETLGGLEEYVLTGEPVGEIASESGSASA